MLISGGILSKKITQNIFLSTALVLCVVFSNGCIRVKTPGKTATLPRFENASKEQLMAEANRLAKVDSLRAKFDVVFEDTTSANLGRSDKYQAANGEIIVQRPANIYLKIEAPVVKVDIVQMTSNGANFRVAVLEDGSSGKFKKFVTGTNSADYSVLQKAVSDLDASGSEKEKVTQKNVNAFSNLRPQHFTDALLIRPLQPEPGQVFYIQSEFFQDEATPGSPKDSPMSLVNHGYYLLEELVKKGDDLRVTRRFWFDRIGTIKLARQQIFDEAGTLESDIVYGNLGNFTATKDYILPMRIDLTRPKEKYKMRLTYQAPESVVIGKEWPEKIFNLENRWELPEVDLDKKLIEMKQASPQAAVKSVQ
jgi:hypothetical protein